MNLRLTLALFFIATFLQSGSYGLTFLLPPLFESFGAVEKDVGSVLAFTAASTIVTVIFLGYITASIGRVTSVVLSSTFISTSLFIFAATDTMGPIVFGAGILLGIGWGAFYVLTPIILTQITEQDQRIRIFTLLSVFIMAGFGLSPVAGAILEKAGYGTWVIFKIFGFLCLISGGVFLLIMPSIAKLSSASGATADKLTWVDMIKVLRSRAVRTIIMIGLGASVFASVTNFQTVYAAERGLDYSIYFLTYTITVIICRVAFASFLGGKAPFGVMACLLAIMTLSTLVLLYPGTNTALYTLGAILFGIGYGVSYPIIKAMAANDAEPHLMSATLQVFGLSYFIGVFGFPFVGGWIISTVGIAPLLAVAALLAFIEFSLALHRYRRDKRTA